MSERFTVVGARGFIGTALVAALRAQGAEVTVRRSDESAERDRGHVIYASGVAWGAERRPAEAYEIHVERVRRALGAGGADSFTFLSSTRVYDGAPATSEDTPLVVHPWTGADTYAISKLAGENLVLAHPDARLRVARLSNVFGPSFRAELYLSQLLRAAVREGVIAVRTARDSAKDYVAIDEVAALVPEIARRGRERLYNVARGRNTTAGDILDAIALATGARVEVAPGSPSAIVPPISIARLAAEFPAPALDVVGAIPELARAFAEHERRKVATAGG